MFITNVGLWDGRNGREMKNHQNRSQVIPKASDFSMSKKAFSLNLACIQYETYLDDIDGFVMSVSA